MNGKQKLMLGAGVLVSYALYRSYQGTKTFVTETINPMSDKNIVFQSSGFGSDPEKIRSADLFFANMTLVNPFASEESKDQARNMKKVFYGQ